MRDFLSSPVFYWIGVSFVGFLALAIIAALLLLAIALIVSFAPRLHYRAPKTNMVLSTYRQDEFTGEGQPIKVAADLQLTRILGLSWKTRWCFGLLLFRPAK